MKKGPYHIGNVRWITALLIAVALPLTASGEAPAGSGPVKAEQQQQTRIVQGTVVDDADGTPLVGVTIKVKGKNTGTVTDVDGNFSLSIPTRGATLQFSYIGYKPQDVYIVDQAIVSVKMKADDASLNEVVVVGAGTQRKIAVTGAIVGVSGKEFNAPTSSLTSNLAGKLAGVISRTSTGEPGSTSEFYIRGVGTFGGRATPLILLDGIEISASDLNRIPAENIETFSILKDASATAIYGARGANGVMLVTTKSGMENQKATIKVTVENSIVSPQHMVDYVDGATYMELYNEAQLARTPNATPRYSQEAIEMTRNHTAPYRYPDVDWQGIMFKNSTMNQRANINISGGGARVTYYMSLQANHDTGLLDIPKVYSFDNNINRWNYNFQNNISYKVTTSTKVTMRMNANIANNKGPNYSVSDLFAAAYDVNPVMFPATFPAQEGDTHIRFGNAFLSGNNTYRNPYAYMLSSFNETNANTINVSMNIDQNFDFVTKGLSAKLLVNLKSWSQVSYHRDIQPYYYRINTTTWDPANPNVFDLERVGDSGQDYVTESDPSRNNDQTIYIDGRIDYNRNFGKHYVSGMAMYMQREFRSGTIPNRVQGLSFRATYDYDHRYLAEFNAGYNGSERLPKGSRFEFFPAVSVGWVASEEKFWAPVKPYVNFFKIRGSYGLVGSDDMGGSHFLFTNDITLGGGGEYKTGINGELSLRGPRFNNYAVENPRWERVKKLDIGVDVELFNQVRITADYFYDKRDRILMERASFPLILGYFNATPWSNIGKVDNRGFDMSIDWKKEIFPKFIVDLRFNMTYNKNKYVYVDEPDYPYVWQTQTGKPLSRQVGYIAEGLFESQEEIDNWPVQSLGSQVMPGDIKYRDVNGDGVVNTEDRVMISPYGGMPRIQYGIGLDINYKNIDFGMFFNGSGKRSLMINNLDPFRSNLNNGDRNVMKFIADNHWSVDDPNPNAKYPRLGLTAESINNNTVASTYWLRNGNFIRLKTLEIGYTFPHVRIYANADNVAVWSKFKEWDPELSYNSYPLQRTINIGAQLKF